MGEIPFMKESAESVTAGQTTAMGNPGELKGFLKDEFI